MRSSVKHPVRYAYAVCNAQGKIASHSYGGELAIYTYHSDALRACANGQHVERVRVSVVRKR